MLAVQGDAYLPISYCSEVISFPPLLPLFFSFSPPSLLLSSLSSFPSPPSPPSFSPHTQLSEETVYTNVAAGVVSGALSSAIANPTDVLKVWGYMERVNYGLLSSQNLSSNCTFLLSVSLKTYQVISTVTCSPGNTIYSHAR